MTLIADSCIKTHLLLPERNPLVGYSQKYKDYKMLYWESEVHCGPQDVGWVDLSAVGSPEHEFGVEGIILWIQGTMFCWEGMIDPQTERWEARSNISLLAGGVSGIHIASMMLFEHGDIVGLTGGKMGNAFTHLMMPNLMIPVREMDKLKFNMYLHNKSVTGGSIVYNFANWRIAYIEK